METVDLKLVLLGALACIPCAGLLVCGGRAGPGRTLTMRSAFPPPSGQPGVGKTCLVYRYLYNTFGETISVRRRCRTSDSAPYSFRP